MNAWQITKKDIRLLLRDRRTLFVLLALPMTFISILGVSTGQLFSEREKARTVRVGVVNEDQSLLAGKLLTEVHELRALELRELTDRRAGEEELAKGSIDVLVFIGPEYHKRVEELDLGDMFYTDRGRLAGKLRSLDIQVEAGAFLANAAQVVEELVFAFALRTIAPDVLRANDPRLARQLFLKAKRATLGRAEVEGTVSGESTPTDTRANIVYQILVPSYTVMFVFFIVNFMGRSLVNERDIGTLNRLRIAPVSRTGLMAGKTFPFLVISLVQTVVLFVAGRLMFQMSWGEHPWMLIPVMFCTSLSAVTLGLLVATIVRTDSQVAAYGNFLVLILAGISGCLMPRSWQPPLMQQIGLVTPHAWALIAYDQLLNRDIPDMRVVWNCCQTLIGFAAGFSAVGWWRFRNLE